MAQAVPIAFGPVPSRRLGQSLGVDHIPPKHCTYSCVYCQVGRTTSLDLERRAFHPPEVVVHAVQARVARCRASGQRIDHVTFVPDGEPTLDVHLGEMLRALRPLGVPLAVITNGSLLWRPEVRADLAAADVVSIKVDTVDDDTWRRINRPGHALGLPVVLAGIRQFAEEYPGRLLTETLLVGGLNDGGGAPDAVARFLATLDPEVAYLGVPTRPPAGPQVALPTPDAVLAWQRILSRHLGRVDLLAGDEAGDFGHAGDPADDLLGILAVHPLQESTARRYLAEGGAGAPTLASLLATGRVVRVRHRGRLFLSSRLAPR